MTGKWRLLLSAVVCLVAIGSAFHFLVMERHWVPDSGIRVVEQGNDEGGRDWVIRLYQSDRRHHWQVSGKGRSPQHSTAWRTLAVASSAHCHPNTYSKSLRVETHGDKKYLLRR